MAILVLLASVAMFSPSKSDNFMPSTPTPNPSGFASSSSSSAQTVIARGVRVEGDFKSQGNVTIEGELVGSITCGGHLTIGSEASIQAAITAEEATISGSVQGNLRITRRLELKATAKIKGDITAEAVAIESGAALEGNCKIGGAKAASQPIVSPLKTKEVTINTPAEAKSEATT